jgi:hypothetical protein
MLKDFVKRGLGKWLLVSLMLGFGLAMAQSEPTLNQVYEAAQNGRLEQAQVMMQQVLVAHPGSGKAHYVQSELWARQGKLGQAREALATAEKLAPGLPFAKPESVQALRTQLAARSMPPSGNRNSTTLVTSAPAAPVASFPWGLVLMLGGAAIALVIFLTRRKTVPAFDAPVAYPGPASFQGGLNGPQGFGMGGGAMAQPVGQAYGQPAGSGLGGRVMGGLATGLAVGAGVMAAEAIGKSLMSHNDGSSRSLDNPGAGRYEPLPGNNDLGGQNFGVNDASSWDDGGSVDSGGDWDN